MQDLHIVLDKESVEHKIEIELPEWELYIDKSQLGSTPDECLKHNIISTGRKYKYVASFLMHCASCGFFLVRHDQENGISVLRNMKDRKKFMPAFGKRGTKLWNDVFYTLEKPVSVFAASKSICRMLVVFSSIGEFPFNAAVANRAFYLDWPDVKNDIPANTYILRIADTGGVLGAFYMNSNFDKSFEQRVHDLIIHIANECHIAKGNIILYGANKGGTGALLHGILGEYRTIAVDPVVTDRFFIEKRNDQHFVTESFSEDKEKKFKNLLEESNNLDHIHIVTSYASEQFKYIKDIVWTHKDVHMYIFNNENIKKQGDVLKNTVVFVKTLINAMYYNICNGGIETDY